MIFSPSSSTCGNTNSTKIMEMIVPRPMQPMLVMAASEVRCVIKMPADAMMVPEVMMVGKD